MCQQNQTEGLKRQIEKVVRESDTWPAWFRRESGLPENMHHKSIDLDTDSLTRKQSGTDIRD